jgi:intracellular sulfur oxidation DsrE/DsrF family protein
MNERRDFLRQVSVIAAGTLVASCADAQQAEAPKPPAAPAPEVAWDMSWLDRVKGEYRTVFDAPAISGGLCLQQVRNYLAGFKTVYGLTDADVTAVLVIRHDAIPMCVDDSMWADGTLGKSTRLNDPDTGKRTKRNPFLRLTEASRFSNIAREAALDTLLERGVIVLACDLALNRLSGEVAERMEVPREEARAMVNAALLPGITRMPSGIFATTRAQMAGCGFMYSA